MKLSPYYHHEAPRPAVGNGPASSPHHVCGVLGRWASPAVAFNQRAANGIGDRITSAAPTPPPRSARRPDTGAAAGCSAAVVGPVAASDRPTPENRAAPTGGRQPLGNNSAKTAIATQERGQPSVLATDSSAAVTKPHPAPRRAAPTTPPAGQDAAADPLDLSNFDPLAGLDLSGLLAGFDVNPVRSGPVELPPGLDVIRCQERRRRFVEDRIHADNAIRQLSPLPDPGETTVAIMRGEYPGIALVPALLEMAGEPADELYITTLSWNARTRDILGAAIDAAQIRRCTLLASEYFAAASKQEFAAVADVLRVKGVRVQACRNHTKLILARFGERHFCISGSFNLRSARSLEQLELTHCRDLYRFHAAWIESTFAGADAR